jgi:Tfp pilus assembly protein PilN
MRYSLTSARAKRIIDTDAQLWLLFTGSIIALFAAIKILLSILIATQEIQMESYRQERTQYEAQIESLQKETQMVIQDIETVSKTTAKNKVIKDSLINLLDLIPDQIYLTEAEASEKMLRIKGYTPSKDIYNFLLKPPLESIFAKTAVSFLASGGGGFVFDSVSVMDEQERLFYEQ